MSSFLNKITACLLSVCVLSTYFHLAESLDQSNPFDPISEMYVNPTLAVNIEATVASIRDGDYDATNKMVENMNAMKYQPSAYWIDKKSKIWLPTNPNRLVSFFFFFLFFF